MFDVSSAEATYSTPDLLAIILLGVIGGIFGSLHNYLVAEVLHTHAIINEKGAAFKILLIATISVITSCCAFGLPWLAECIERPSNLKVSCPTVGESGNYKSFQCQSGHYNDLASLLLNANDDAIRNMFSTDMQKEFRNSILFIFFAAIDCLGMITYGIAIPSGLFIPVILAGAIYGRLVGRLSESVSTLDTVMLVLLISTKAFTTKIVKLKGLPYLEAHAEPYMRHLVAGHNGFPVIDEPSFSDAPELCRLFLRSHSLVLLYGKNFSRDEVLCEEKIQKFAKFDFANAGSGESNRRI
ncbi:Chloride channel, voltage gated [Dillenia turbinata]|uniref:Chloride channel, voltage gated n=1 Tax=Dillenia turbinata TaxID=194707 RepID=A0AAN8UV40_9MAGN